MAGWHGAAVDPETGVLHAPAGTTEQPIALEHTPQRHLRCVRRSQSAGRQAQTVGQTPTFNERGLIVRGPFRPSGLPFDKKTGETLNELRLPANQR